MKEQVEARNDLESYAYSLKNQIGDKEKLGGKLDDADKKTIEEAVDQAISWLDSHKVCWTCCCLGRVVSAFSCFYAFII